MSRRRLLFLADSSSQLKPAYRIAEAFGESGGWDVVGNLVPSGNSPTRRQVMEARIRCPLTAHSISRLAAEGTIFEFDAVLCFMPGSRLHSFLHHLERAVAAMNPRARPVTITGYNGVVYERYLEGLLWRTGYDFIGVNSRADHRRFRDELDALGVSSSSLVTIGFTLARSRDPVVPRFHDMPTQDVVFATQAIVPKSKPQREYLLRKLRAYAEAFPSRKIYIKPRTFPDERTFHVEEHHYAVLYEELFGQNRPDNLLFGYGSFDRYLSRVGLVVTVSSTAVVEGLSYGVPGAILTDFGIKESLGNHFFRDSGMLTTMDALLADQAPVPNVGWMRDNGFGQNDDVDALIQRVEALLEQQAKSGRLPLAAPYYSAERAPYIHEGTLPIKDKQQPHVDLVDNLYRKARKLVRSPKRFVQDAKALEKLRGMFQR